MKLLNELEAEVRYWKQAVESVRSKLEKAEAEVNQLNNLLREVGWGQGEIDSAATIAEENDKLRAELERLREDKARLDWLESKASARFRHDYGFSRTIIDAARALSAEELGAELERLQEAIKVKDDALSCLEYDHNGEIVVAWPIKSLRDKALSTPPKP